MKALIPIRRKLAICGALLLATATGLGGAEPARSDSSGIDYLRGVNLAGAEFGDVSDGPGVHGTDYIYPVSAFAGGYDEPAFLAAQGINLFRLPVRWERLQPSLMGPLAPDELSRLHRAIAELTALGAVVVVDVHNYAYYRDMEIGSDAVSVAAFADFWARLASALPPHDLVVLGLMNEPFSLTPGDWVDQANAAIAAIRAAGSTHLIAVPGTRWSGAHSWFAPDPELLAEAALARVSGQTPPPVSNAEAMVGIVDPANHYVIEVHQYLDADSSGTQESCVSTEQARHVMGDISRWLADNDLRGFLGEIGIPRNDACLAAFDALLTHVAANRRHYYGIAYWAVGPWWGDYPFRLDQGNADDPRLRMLLTH